jgi:regulatory protein YycI of two-component signal transduction system YycFG
MELLVNYGLQVATTLLITLIGVLGTYLTLQLGKNANLNNINAAQKELIRAAKITVGELQQTVVSGYKAANEDGKLTTKEIVDLRMKLIDKTEEKLSAPAIALLEAASVDVEGLILGVGESWIERIKQTYCLGE